MWGSPEHSSSPFIEDSRIYQWLTLKVHPQLLPFGAIRVWFSRPGMFRLWTFQRKVWPLPGSWENLQDLGISYLARASLFTCGLELRQMVCTPGVIYGGGVGLHGISLTSGGPGGWVIKVRHKGVPPCLCDWLPIKPGILRLSKLPWLAELFMCSHTLFLGELIAIHIITEGEDNWKLVPHPSAASNLYLLTVFNRNNEYKSFSEFCESSSESLNLRVVLRTFNNTFLPVGGLSLHSPLQFVFLTTPINGWHLLTDYLATKLGQFCPAYKAILC